VLEEIARPLSDAEKSRHEVYLSLIQLPLRRDPDLADTLDDPSPSTASRQLACLQPHELLGAEEFGRVSSQTPGAVQILGGPSPVD
jgi:hypothetical protein